MTRRTARLGGTRRERSLGKVIKKQDAKIKTQKSTIKKQSARIQSLDGKVGRLKSTNSKLYKDKSQQRVMGGLRAALKSQRRQKASIAQKRAAYVRMRAERKAASLARQRPARGGRRTLPGSARVRRAVAPGRRGARARPAGCCAGPSSRSERWRMLDPIHIYVADGSGAARSDWLCSITTRVPTTWSLAGAPRRYSAYALYHGEREPFRV